jgi:hypothetical protein
MVAEWEKGQGFSLSNLLPVKIKNALQNKEKNHPDYKRFIVV